MTTRTFAPLLFLLLSLLLLPTAASRAEEAAEGENPPARDQSEKQATAEPVRAFEIAPVVVRSSRIRQTAEDPSSFTTVIEPAQFASQFRTTEDLLSRIPGVNIKRYGGLGQYSTVSIRGSSAEQVLVLVDGVKLNTGEGGSVDFSTIPLDSIQEIQVIRGGGTTLYGSDAIGGVVNIITKEPDGRAAASAAVSYGSLNTLKAWITGSARVKNLAFLGSVTHFQSDGDFRYTSPKLRIDGRTRTASEEGTRENNDFFADNLLLKTDIDFTKTLRLTLNNDLFYTERGQAGTIFDPRLFARQHVLRNLTQVRLQKDAFFFDDLGAYFTLFNNYEWRHFRDPLPGLGSPGENTIDTSSWNYAFGFQLGAELFLAFRGMDHAVAFRGELRRDELRDRVQPWEEGYDDPYRTSYQWHLQDEIVFLGGRLSLIPGVHYEESTDFGPHWTGKIGAVAQPLYWLQVKANFENSYRKPSFSELYYPDQGYIRGEPNLRAEQGTTLDAGLGLNFPRVFFQAAFFRNWIQESIIWLPVSFYTVAPVNTGPVDQWGVEVDAEYSPWDVVHLSGNYTFLNAISKETGQQQDGRPRHTANFKAALQGILGEVYTEVQYLSRIPVRFTETAQRSVNPRTVVDLGATLNLLSLPLLREVPRLGTWTLGFEVKNVGDVSVYDAQFFPLPGRMFFLTMHAAI